MTPEHQPQWLPARNLFVQRRFDAGISRGLTAGPAKEMDGIPAEQAVKRHVVAEA